MHFHFPPCPNYSKLTLIIIINKFNEKVKHTNIFFGKFLLVYKSSCALIVGHLLVLAADVSGSACVRLPSHRINYFKLSFVTGQWTTS